MEDVGVTLLRSCYGPVYCPMDFDRLVGDCCGSDCLLLVVFRFFPLSYRFERRQIFESCRRQGDVRREANEVYLFSLNIGVSGKSVVLSLPGPDFVFGPGIDDVFCSSDFSRVLTT